MSIKIELNAETRTDLGKGASRRLRRTGKTPAVVYGIGEPSSITLEHKNLWKAQESESFYSSIVSINIDGKSVDVVVKDMQRHPAKSLVMHIDFQRIDPTKAIIVNVPLHFINGQNSPAVKLNGGQIQILDNGIKVECLPKDLPEYIVVDLGNVNVDDIVHISNVTLPAGVVSVDLSHGADHDLPLVQVVSARAEPTPGAAAASGKAK